MITYGETDWRLIAIDLAEALKDFDRTSMRDGAIAREAGARRKKALDAFFAATRAN